MNDLGLGCEKCPNTEFFSCQQYPVGLNSEIMK